MQEQKTKTEEIKEEAEDIVNHIGDFLETYYQLVTIRLAKKVVDITSSLINSIILALLGFLFLSFVSLGLAWWLGNVVDNRAGGFFITAGIYLVIIVLLIVMRKKLIFPFLRNFLTRKIYE
jgi:putative superfamily III holin-X